MQPVNNQTGISVLMPTYKQAYYIARAIKSLQLQSFSNWELIIINDGSPDNTELVVKPFLDEKKIRYYKNDSNIGLGACLNKAIQLAKFDLIAYLPSDDIFYKDHLSLLYHQLLDNPNAIAVYSNAKSDYYDDENAKYPTTPISRSMQLVQVLQRRAAISWLERSDMVTDDLGVMYFNNLRSTGNIMHYDHETCIWGDHKEQRSKIISEAFFGGIYKYKIFYNVQEPLRYHSSFGNYIDEIGHYAKFRKPQITRRDGLKILIVGELAYNPERIYALEEHGHQLYGLWCSTPLCFNTIGPLPFGNVQDIPYENWQHSVKEIQPDIIYCLLNMQTLDLAHEVLQANTGLPFVWHFKEGPFFCLKSRAWEKLLDLYNYCDGRIFTNIETKQWFDQFLIETDNPVFILDGDLPKADWFNVDRSDRLSDKDGEIHTVLAGRPMGFEIDYIKALAEQRIHLHFYGDLFQSLVKTQLDKVKLMNNPYFHLHPNCNQDEWVKEFSQYDAGWLHLFQSKNEGELLRADWNDLNYPARIATLASAGLPLIQKDNTNHIVATQSLSRNLEIGIFFNDITDLKNIFSDCQKINELRENAWRSRRYFQFDHYVPELCDFFTEVIRKVEISQPRAQSGAEFDFQTR